MTDLKTLQLAAILKDLRDQGEQRLVVNPPPAQATIFKEMLIIIKNARLEEATSTNKIRKLEDLMAFNADTMPEDTYLHIIKEVQKVLKSQ